MGIKTRVEIPLRNKILDMGDLMKKIDNSIVLLITEVEEKHFIGTVVHSEDVNLSIGRSVRVKIIYYKKLDLGTKVVLEIT